MAPLRIGSLCSGYRGLDMAIEDVFGATTAWVSDIDPGANTILTHRWPATPNIGDLTVVDWGQVEPVDILCGGYPCQPFSHAGLRKGTEDERHIWPYIADALRVLRPRVAIFENVAGHLRLGFDTVLADLARLGFDAEWCLVRASEVGAPHQRNRLFILAWPADTDGAGLERRRVRGAAAKRGEPAADTADLGHERVGRARGWGDGPADDRQSAANTPRIGRGEGRTEPAGFEGGPDTALSGASHRSTAADSNGSGRRSRQGIVTGLRPAERVEGDQPGRDWGKYAAAIRRWGQVLGRPAPWATDDRNRLAPAFVEWLMGLPAGHVTEVPGLTRTQQLKALGNGVVPQQAAATLRLLVDRAAPSLASAA